MLNPAQKFTQPGRWCHYRFMTSDLWCSPKCTRRPHQVSLDGLSRPQPVLGSLSQQFPVLQRKGENPSRPFPPSPVTLQTCLPLHPSSSWATSEGSAQLPLFSASSSIFNFFLPGLHPWPPRSGGMVPKIHPWSFSYKKISESISWGT